MVGDDLGARSAQRSGECVIDGVQPLGPVESQDDDAISAVFEFERRAQEAAVRFGGRSARPSAVWNRQRQRAIRQPRAVRTNSSVYTA